MTTIRRTIDLRAEKLRDIKIENDELKHWLEEAVRIIEESHRDLADIVEADEINIGYGDARQVLATVDAATRDWEYRPRVLAAHPDADNSHVGDMWFLTTDTYFYGRVA